MLKLIRNASLALTGALAATAILPPVASADGLSLTIDENGPRLGIYAEDDGPRRWRDDRGPRDRWERRGDDRRDRDDRRWDRDDRRGPPPRCTAERALDKAARMGLRRVRIRDIDRDTIEVSGRKFGERYVVTFARAPFCPVVSW